MATAGWGKLQRTHRPLPPRDSPRVDVRVAPWEIVRLGVCVARGSAHTENIPLPPDHPPSLPKALS